MQYQQQKTSVVAGGCEDARVEWGALHRKHLSARDTPLFPTYTKSASVFVQIFKIYVKCESNTFLNIKNNTKTKMYETYANN